jgi:membrane protease YdiL (CAAX protease family)
MGDRDPLTGYLDDLRARLRGLPPDEVDDIVAELRSHVLESLRESGPPGASGPGVTADGTAPGEALAAIFDRVGAPADLAALYRADRQLGQALDPVARGFRPLRLLTGVVRWASVSLAGAGALLVLVAGYGVAISFCIAAATKLFAPGRVGLFRLPGGEYSLRLGLSGAPRPAGEELLGFWIIPIGMVAAAAVYWSTTRLVRAAARLWRRHRPAPVPRAATGNRWSGSVWFVALELAAVVALYIADAHHLVPFSNTPFLLLLGWASLRLRGLRWRDVGLARPADWRRTLLLGVVAGLAMESFALLVTEPFIAKAFGHHPDLSDFKFMVGNLKALLVLQLLNWTLAAFGEEMVYRGFLMNRVAGLAGRLGAVLWRERPVETPQAAWIAAILAVSVLFGWAHAEGQGLPGMAQEGFNGLLLGLLYLGNRRQLAVPIVAHGVSNTLAFVLIYFGLYPGVS